MATIDLKRNYNLLDSELCMFTSNLCNFLTRDLADLSVLGLTAPMITSLKALGDAFEIYPPDATFAGDLMIATENKNALREQIQEIIRTMALRVETKWGADSGKYKRLNLGPLVRLTDDMLLVTSRDMKIKMTEYLTALASLGLTQDMLDDWEDLNDQFELARNAQADAVAVRDEKTMERINKGNQLYGYVVTYCNFGKRIYEKTNPARYNDYIIYTGSTPGTLEPPTGISFTLANMTIRWSPVTNATSYATEISDDDGANYTEIYAGTDNQFIFDGAYEGNLKLRVRARNAGGFSDYSDTYSFAYFSTLPAPESLTISLVSETTGLIRLNFEEVASATTYKIFRSVVGLGMPAGEFTYITEQSGNEYVGNTTAGMRNWFHIKAGNATQLSVASSAVFMDMAVLPE